jgi:hypothetical protein
MNGHMHGIRNVMERKLLKMCLATEKLPEVMQSRPQLNMAERVTVRALNFEL